MLAQEELRTVLLDTRNRILDVVIVYQGNVNSTIVRMAEVFREANLVCAPNAIIAHRDPAPSQDVSLTKQTAEAGQLLGIDVLDHVVISRGRFVSLKDQQVCCSATLAVAQHCWNNGIEERDMAQVRLDDVEVPGELLDLLGRSKLSTRDRAGQVRVALAIHLFITGEVSFGSAAELAGEQRADFVNLLNECSVRERTVPAGPREHRSA